ncbi:MAG: hypothetical protein AB6733_15310 [Clostridiaceae bacterium]
MNKSEIIYYWMSIIDDKNFLDIWKDVLRDDDSSRVIPEEFFSIFRPSGNNLDKVFKPIKEGKEIQERILEIYNATSKGYHISDYYFEVRKPKITSINEIHDITEKYIKNVIRISEKIDKGHFDRFIKSPPRIEIVQGLYTDKNSDGLDFGIVVYDLMQEFVNSLKPIDSHALLLKKPLYHMACNYDIVHYVLWPIYKNGSFLEDPFKPFVELWKLGAILRFDIDNNILKIFVNDLKEENNI